MPGSRPRLIDVSRSAQGRHAAELERAAAVEAAAWHALLAVPGMTITTAAVLTSTSESTVNRWTSRARQRPEVASVVLTLYPQDERLRVVHPQPGGLGCG